MRCEHLVFAAIAVTGFAGKSSFDFSTCEVNVTWDLRDWVVDYLRPTLSYEGKAVRKAPFEIDSANKMAALLANNSYPGPVLEAIEDQMVCVTILNNFLSDPVSIHWHGVHMVGFPSMDGVYGVTQGAIMPQGGSFTYRFRPNVGTHFWHAHTQAMQADRGLKGPIIIHAKNDPHKHMYDEERIVTLSDQWVNPEVCLKAEGGLPGNPVCAEIDKALWNGQWGDGSEEYPWPMVTVDAGKCYRFRFIGIMGQAQNFQITMAGHNMTIIAIDGKDVEPTIVSQFDLHAGERADVIVCANQAPGNYLITADYDLADFLEIAPAPKMPRVDSSKFWAFLNYAGHTKKPSKISRKFLYPLIKGYKTPKGTGGGAKPKSVTGPVFDTNFQAGWGLIKNLEPVPEPETADVTYVLDVGITGPNYEPGVSPYATSNRLYMFNKIQPWKKPLTPLLHTKGQCGAEGVPFITIDNATTVEVVINNLSPTAHVLHMHGMYFSVINYAPFSNSDSWCGVSRPDCFSKSFDKALKDCPGARRGSPNTTFSTGDVYWGCPYDPATDKKSQNLEAPLQKDMVSLWRRSWAVIRFKADNPGTWLFHCHMEQHMPTGQIMAFNIKPKDQPPIPDDVPTEGPCPKWSDVSSKRPDSFV